MGKPFFNPAEVQASQLHLRFNFEFVLFWGCVFQIALRGGARIVLFVMLKH